MQNLSRLLLVVTMLLAGTGWSVGRYLEGMREPVDHLNSQHAVALPTAPQAMLRIEAADRDANGSEVPPVEHRLRRKTIVLSVDPTSNEAVSLARRAR